MSDLIIQIEEKITLMQALEYLAYGWEPYADNDELLTEQPRATKRGNGYFEQSDYRNKINQSIAKLGNLIRNGKIKLPLDLLCPISPIAHNTTSSPFVTNSNAYEENKICYNIPIQNGFDNSKIESVQIKFMKIDKNYPLPSFINNKSIIPIYNLENSNYYYILVCFVDFGYSLFMYPDYKGIINFSELEQYKETKAETRGRPQKLSDYDFAICFLENIDDILAKGNTLKKTKNGIMADALKKKYPEFKISDTTIEDKTRPFLDIFEGKYVEVHNR